MIRFSFRKGLKFIDRALGRWSLESKLFNHKFRLETAAGERKDLTNEELLERWRDGEWVIDPECLSARADVVFTATPANLTDLPVDDQAVAKGRLDYIHEVRRLFREVGQDIVSTVATLQIRIAAAAEAVKARWVEKVKQGDKIAAITLEKVTPPSAATFWRWWGAYKPTQCVTKLVDRRGKHASRRTRLHGKRLVIPS